MSLFSIRLSGAPTSAISSREPELQTQQAFHASHIGIHLASRNLIHTHIQEALEQLESLKESGLLKKLKALKKSLVNDTSDDCASVEADDASEQTLLEEEIDIDSYIKGMELSLKYLDQIFLDNTEVISKDGNPLDRIKISNIIFNDRTTNIINQIKKNNKKIIEEIDKLLDNPYQQPCHLENRWFAWIVTNITMLINIVFVYLCGVHIAHLSPEISSIITAILTILPRAIQEKFNLHDINGAYKEKEWKDIEIQLKKIKKSVESIQKKFKNIDKEIKNYYLIELTRNTLYQATPEQNNKNHYEIEVNFSIINNFLFSNQPKPQKSPQTISSPLLTYPGKQA